MVLSKDVFEYLTSRGWTPTNQGWISPYDEFEYVRWDLLSALEIEESHEKEVLRNEWRAT